MYLQQQCRFYCQPSRLQLFACSVQCPRASDPNISRSWIPQKDVSGIQEQQLCIHMAAMIDPANHCTSVRVSADGVPILVLLERLVPKKSTDVPIMTTRFTCMPTQHLSMCATAEPPPAEGSSPCKTSCRSLGICDCDIGNMHGSSTLTCKGEIAAWLP